MTEQKNIRVIFTEKADIILSDIIKKYGLQETEDETFKKFKEGKLPKIIIIDHLTKDFTKGTITEKELISSLQKDLNIPQQIAQEITKEIINNLVPLLEKISGEQLEKDNLKDQPTTPKNIMPSKDEEESFQSAIRRPSISNVEENKKDLGKIKKPIIAKKSTISEKPEMSIKKNMPTKTINRERKETPRSSGSDAYRESI